MDHSHASPEQQNGTRSRFKWVLLAFILIAGYFFVAEHRAHLAGYLQYLPILLLLACPLLHLFMHGGHDHGAGHDHGRPADRERKGS